MTTSTRAKPVVPADLLTLLQSYAGTTGVISSRCYTEDQALAFTQLRAAFPDAMLNVNHALNTAALTFVVQEVPLRFVFELREVADQLEKFVSE